MANESRYLVTAEQLTEVADAIRDNCTLTDTKLSYPWGFIEGIEDDGEQYLINFLNGEISYVKCNVSYLSDYAFYYNSSVISTSFPACITIGRSAFYRCSNLTSISFPVCTTIGNYAFEYCSNLTSIKFPVCTTIGNYAFYRCSNLISISFPACTTIGTSAFGHCLNLTSINFPVCTTIGGSAFIYCSRLLSAYFLGSSIPSLAYSNAFYSTPIANFTTYTSGEYGSIFVRASMLEEFKSATNWTYFSEHMVGLTDEEIANL